MERIEDKSLYMKCKCGKMHKVKLVIREADYVWAIWECNFCDDYAEDMLSRIDTSDVD